MPWCPNCKVEYIDGMTVCADCGAKLVEELPKESEFIPFMETEKELFANKFIEFLRYSKIDSASYEFDEEKQKWVVLIERKLEKQVAKLYKAFYAVESEKVLDSAFSKDDNDSNGYDLEDDNDSNGYDLEDDDDLNGYDLKDNSDSNGAPSDKKYATMFSEEQLQDIIDTKRPREIQPAAYVKKEEQYKELKSSASTFVMVALLGYAIIILNVVDIIHIFAGTLPYIVMNALLLAFLYIGFSSYVKAKKIQKEIAGENNVTEAINNWLSENVTAEQLEELTDPADAAEIRFFQKLEKMKEMITAEFGDLDDSYLDLLVEEYYNDHFETSAE